MNTDIWQAERSWWLNGAAEAALHMAPNCLVTTPEGVLQGDAVIDALASAARWTELTISDRLMAETAQVRVLSYRAVARRGGDEKLRLQCSSCWVRLDRWRLVSHQRALR